MKKEITITIDHVLGAGLCAKGTRGWARSNNVDLRDFLKNGMVESKVEALNDAFANRVLAHARAQHKENQQ